MTELKDSNQTMFGSLLGAVTEQMHSLSGEEMDPGRSSTRGSRTRRRSTTILATARPQIAVLGSSNPQTDVSTIQWLFPQKFKTESTQESVVLTEKTENGLVLMIVDCHTSGQNIPIHWKNATFVLDEREIIIAAERCRGKAATIYVRETIELARDRSTTLAVIRLSGGGNLVLMSKAFLECPKGRKAFSQFVTSRETIETMERNRDNCSSEALNGENLLQQLEDEFATRTRRRRSDENMRAYSSSSMSEDSEGSYGVPTRNFPTLGLSLQRKHGFMQQDVPINARAPIPFETDLFSGKVSILIKPEHRDDDPYHFEEVFSRTKIRLVLQIQGNFKYKPQGTVYAGLELVDDMKAALIMQGFCSLILRHIRKKHPDCHFSFGDEKEKPHIVVPAWTFFDRLVVTKPTSTAPPINEPLVESQGSVTARQSSQSKGAWNTADTYSFASYSECIDLPSWHMVDASFARNTDMHNFLSDSAIKMVMYEHRDATVEPEKHLQVYNHYFFSLQIKHLGNVLDAEEALNKDEDKVETAETLPWGKAKKVNRYDDSYGEFATIEMLEADRESVVNDDDESVECDEDDEDLVDDALIDADEMELPCKSLLEATNQICPAWVEVIMNVPGKYKKLYAFQVSKNTKAVFRTPAEFKTYLPFNDTSVYVKSLSSPRISASEEARRILGYAYSQALKHCAAKARQFAYHKSPYGVDFLRREQDCPQQQASGNVQKCGYMARALSERHWREEFVRLFDDHVAFFHPLKTKPSFRIYCRAVIATKRLKDTEGPQLVGYHFLEVETVGRRVYLMFASQAERDSWADALEKAVQINKVECEEECFTLDGIDDPTDQFLHKSSGWDCQQRRLLNCRRFYFNTPPVSEPAALVETAMWCADEAQENPRCESKLIKFLDSVAALKDVDLYSLDEQSKMAFLLNLFHLMTMHAYLLLGPPNSSFKYVSLVQMVSYQVSDDIFCLAELEHNIIRGAMSYPSQFSPKLVLPKSKYGFALKTSDFRLNFALNYGALNQPVTIPIYKAPILDVQFEAVCLVALEKVSVEKTRRKVKLTLPEIIRWYSEDFGDTFQDLLLTIGRYIDDSCRTLLVDEVGDDIGKLTLKYLPAVFECRPLTLESSKARGHNVSFKRKGSRGDVDEEE